MAFIKRETKRRQIKPNYRFSFHLMGHCFEHDFDVFEELLKIAMDDRPENTRRFDALVECAKYIYPKPKPIDSGASVRVQEVESRSLEDLEREVLEKLEERRKRLTITLPENAREAQRVPP